MGRPERNPVEEIKTKLLMYYLCEELCIEKSGTALSHYFEGTRRASSKWKRFLEGVRTPSVGTIQLLLNKLNCKQNTADFGRIFSGLWNSPLWAALQAGQQESEYWLMFYKSMPVRFQKHVFYSGSSFSDSFKRRYPRQSEVISIEKHSDLDGFAFLIALARDSRINNLGLYVHTLDLSLYRLFYAFCQHQPFKFFCTHLWVYFQKHIVMQDRHVFGLLEETRWQESEIEVVENRERDAYYLRLAEKAGFISNNGQARQFLFYFHTGNSEIATELEKYHSNEPLKYIHLSALVTKLNRLRKQGDRIRFKMPYGLQSM